MVEGKNAYALLQYVCSNDISKLKPGKAQYNCFPNGEGGIVDDLIVYQLQEEKYLLVVNASNIEKDWAWLQKHNANFKAQLEDQSDDTALLAIQGPKALEAMQHLTAIDLRHSPTTPIKAASLLDIQTFSLRQLDIQVLEELKSTSIKNTQQTYGKKFYRQEPPMRLFQ